MDRGYIKLWRKSLDGGWIKNHKLWAVWTWCLMKATHDPYEAVIGFQRVPLGSGQFVFGRKTGALELGMTERSFRTCIQALANMQNVTIKSTNKFSVLTIANWDTYQSTEVSKRPAKRPTTDQQVSSKCPASDHIQEHKNIRTEEQNLKTPSASDDASIAQECLLTKRKRVLNGKRYQSFMRFWDAFDYKKDRAQAADAWLDIPLLTNTLVDQIVAAAQIEAKNRPDLVAKGRTPIYAQGWITARRWEDEHHQPEVKRYDTGRF